MISPRMREQEMIYGKKYYKMKEIQGDNTTIHPDWHIVGSHRQTDRQTDRKTDTHTHTQTRTHTQTHTETHTHMHTHTHTRTPHTPHQKEDTKRNEMR